MSVDLNKDETIEDLQCGGLMLIQKKDGFRFGLDSVLLANFVDIKEGDTVLDIGTGSGIISILIAGKTAAKIIYGLEIQNEMVEMAQRNVVLNNLQDRIKIVQGDIKNGVEYFGPSYFNAIVVNPPYLIQGGGIMSCSNSKALSKNEIACTLEDIISVSGKLIVMGGQLAIVHKTKRLVDVLFLMRKYNIEPKYLRFIHSMPNQKPNIFLVKGIKGGRPYLNIDKPLYIFESQGVYSEEAKKIYNMN